MTCSKNLNHVRTPTPISSRWAKNITTQRLNMADLNMCHEKKNIGARRKSNFIRHLQDMMYLHDRYKLYVLDIDVIYYLDEANFTSRIFFQSNEYRLINLRHIIHNMNSSLNGRKEKWLWKFWGRVVNDIDNFL